MIDDRNKYLDAKNANNAPTEEANETKIVPFISPNNTPPARVRIAAPGTESAVDKT